MQFPMIPFRFPGIRGVRCAFSTRVFGSISLHCGNEDGRALERRLGLAPMLGVDAVAEVHQVHGIRTVFDPMPSDMGAEPEADADGMATQRKGLALMIKTADCQPILFAHASGRFIAAIHSGWRGNRQDYPYAAARAFCERYGLDPKDVWAVRGPSLGPSAAEFVNFDDEWGQEYLPWYDQAARTVDLWSLTRDQLCRAGIPRNHVLGLDLCTYANADMFYSYRHHRRHGSPDGRQAGFIWIEEN